jgi:hypothetical protein
MEDSYKDTGVISRIILKFKSCAQIVKIYAKKAYGGVEAGLNVF